MDLPEHHLALGPVCRTPGSDPPLQSTPYAVVDPLRVAASELAQDRDWAQRRRTGEHRHDLLVPQSFQRIPAHSTASSDNACPTFVRAGQGEPRNTSRAFSPGI